MFYEDVSMETREKIRMWLSKDRMGELVLDERPFVTYRSVVLSKAVPGRQYTHRLAGMPYDTYSGTFTVEFELYEPYGFLNYKFYKNLDNENTRSYCGMVEEMEMPPAPTVTDKTFLIYNPGTVTCDTVIRIAGTAPNGITIKNKTNGTSCTLSSLPDGKTLEIDSKLGTVKADGYLAFEYHESGFIRLASYDWKYDNVTGQSEEGSTSVFITNTDTDEGMVGKYIRMGSAWNKITEVGDHSITVEKPARKTAVEICMIAGMNEMEIEGDGYTLTTLSVDYAPRIA